MVIFMANCNCLVSEEKIPDVNPDKLTFLWNPLLTISVGVLCTVYSDKLCRKHTIIRIYAQFINKSVL